MSRVVDGLRHLMLRTRLAVVREELPEKRDFEAARKASEDAQAYARDSLASIRRDLNFLEDALIPVQAPMRRHREDRLT